MRVMPAREQVASKRALRQTCTAILQRAGKEVAKAISSGGDDQLVSALEDGIMGMTAALRNSPLYGQASIKKEFAAILDSLHDTSQFEPRVRVEIYTRALLQLQRCVRLEQVKPFNRNVIGSFTARGESLVRQEKYQVAAEVLSAAKSYARKLLPGSGKAMGICELLRIYANQTFLSQRVMHQATNQNELLAAFLGGPFALLTSVDHTVDPKPAVMDAARFAYDFSMKRMEYTDAFAWAERMMEIARVRSFDETGYREGAHLALAAARCEIARQPDALDWKFKLEELQAVLDSTA